MPTLEWNVKDCLEKCSPKNLQKHVKVFNRPRRKISKNLTFRELRDAYEHLAKIIAVYGDKYLPLFERLHSEITKLRSKNELLEVAKIIAQEKLSTGNISGNSPKKISHIFSHVSHTNIFH